MNTDRKPGKDPKVMKFPKKEEVRKYKIDGTKIKTIKEVGLLLDGLGLWIHADTAQFHKLKHLIADGQIDKDE